MPVAQGINKRTTYKKQSGLGVAASGSGGQTIRRTSSIFSAPIDTFETNEIVGHQQSTGVGLGVVKPTGKIDGLLSPLTYSAVLGSLLRRDFAAVTAITGASITIAGSGPTYTVTRASGSFLTDGIKQGDVVRLSVGTFNAANLNKNLLVITSTALVLTVRPVNGVALVAEGPIATSTVSLPGKKTLVPLTGHTTDWYSIEEWYSDLTRSELYVDQQFAQADLSLPGTGNATISLNTVGRTRVLAGAQVLTTPTAETTSQVLTAVQGVVVVGGTAYANITGASITINANVAHSDPVIGSNVVDDLQRGDIMVSGSFTAKFDAATLQTVFDNRTTTSLTVVITADATANADFVAITIPMLNLTGDAPDDGEKAIVRTYPFTAKLNSAGGAALATDQTIISIQDSLA